MLGASCAALFPRTSSPEDKAKAEASYKRDGAHFFKSEFDQAIKEFSDAIRLDPKNPSYYYFRGFAYASKRRLDKAIENYNQANKHLGKKAEAEADMKKGRELGFQD